MSSRNVWSPESSSTSTSFENALEGLIKRAEAENVDLSLARDVEAKGDGYWMVEISRVVPRDE